MTASCPNCSAALPWDKVRGTHVCHACHANLVIDSDASSGVCVVIWMIAEIPLFLLVPLWWLRISLSWGLGMAIWYLICNASTKTVRLVQVSAGRQAGEPAGPA